MASTYAVTFRTQAYRADLVGIVREYVANADPDVRGWQVALNEHDSRDQPVVVDVWVGPRAGGIALSKAEEWEPSIPGSGHAWTITGGAHRAARIAADIFDHLTDDGLVTGLPLQAVEDGHRVPQVVDAALVETISRTAQVPPGTVLTVAHLNGKGLTAARSRGESAESAQKRVMRELDGIKELVNRLGAHGVMAALAVDADGPQIARVLGLDEWEPGAWVVAVMDDDSRWQTIASGTRPITRDQARTLATQSLAAASEHTWDVSAVNSVVLRGMLLPSSHDTAPGTIPEQVTTAVISATQTPHQIAQRLAAVSKTPVTLHGDTFVIDTAWGAMAVSPAPQWDKSMLPMRDESQPRYGQAADALSRVDMTTGTMTTAFGTIHIPDVAAVAEEKSAAKRERATAPKSHSVAITATGRTAPPTALIGDLRDDNVLTGFPLVAMTTEKELAPVYPDDVADALADPRQHVPAGTVVEVVRLTPLRPDGSMPAAEREHQIDALSEVRLGIFHVTGVMPALIGDALVHARYPGVLPVPEPWKPGAWAVIVWSGEKWLTVAEATTTPHRDQIASIVTDTVTLMRRYCLLAAPDNTRALGLTLAEVDVDAATVVDPEPERAPELIEALKSARSQEQRAQAAEGRILHLEREVADLRRRNAALARDADKSTEVDVVAAVGAERRAPAQQTDTIGSPVPPPSAQTVAGALEAARETFPGLLITEGALGSASALSVHTGSQRTWVRRVWGQLAAMDAMIRARAHGWSGSLGEWVRTAQCEVPRHWFVPTESDWVMGNDRARRQRTFDVPNVGAVEVFAHWRIGGNQPPAPRMYVHDTGSMVAVVYAGEHLLNATTART